MKSKKALSFLTAFTMAVTTFLGTGVATMPEKIEAAPAGGYRNVMYYGDWSVYAGQNYFYPSDIDASLLTHLNFAFLDMDANGDLVLCDEYADFEKTMPEHGKDFAYGAPYGGVIGAMSILRAKNPNLKIGVSIGGWTRCGDFSSVAADPAKRKNFVKNAVDFIDYVGFDFIDIDWEYPGSGRGPDPEGTGVPKDEGCPASPEDGHNFTLLMQDFRKELDALGQRNGRHYELSAAMSAAPGKMEAIEYDKVLESVDFLNMMTYDLNGAWSDYTAHQTPLYTNPAYDNDTQPDGVHSIDNCISYLKDTYGNKIDYSQITIGVAAYTRGWGGVQKDTGKDPKAPGLYAQCTKNSVKDEAGLPAGSFSYRNLDTVKKNYGVKEYYDETAQAAYLYNEDTGYFFTYDSPRSVKAKGEYIKKNGLGGFICWMASQDDNNELTRTMKESLIGNSSFPDNPVVNNVPKTKADVSFNGKNGLTITLTNQEKSTAKGKVMQRAESFKKTLLNSKLYIKTKTGATIAPGESGADCGKISNVNGVGIMDFGGSWEMQQIPAGKVARFPIKINGIKSIDDIESITITNRITPSMPEFGERVIYGEKPAETAPEAPVISATAGDKEVKLAWKTVNGASSYEIYEVNGSSYNKIGTSSKPNFVVKNLENDKEYTFVVKATNKIGASDYSNAATATPVKPKLEAPAFPETVTAVAGDKEATISWNKVDTATSYEVYKYNGKDYVKVATTKDTTYTDKNLVNGEDYRYAVKAVNEAGASGFSKTVVVTPVAKLTAPEAPKVVAAGGNNIVNLNWNNVKNADSYEVCMIVNGKETKKATVTGTSYTFNNLENGKEYTFGVKAVNKAGASKMATAKATPVAEVVKPVAPVVNATAGDKTATITWNNVKGADKYEVYMIVNGKETKKATVTGTSYTFDNLENGKTYTFGVKAVNKAGTSDMATTKATPVAKVVAPKAPTGVKAIANKNTVTITWNNVKNADSYEVYQQISWDKYDKIASVNGTSAVIENLADGDYTLVVKAVNAAGESDYSAAVTVTIKTEEVKPNPDPDPDPNPNPNPNPNPDPNPGEGDVDNGTWDSTKVYLTGDKVTFNGVEYKCKWWSQNNQPDSSDAWEEVEVPGGSIEWKKNKIYRGGDKVTFNGQTFEAKWYAQGEQPDASNQWGPWKVVA